MNTEGHERYFKTDFKFSGGQQSEFVNCNSARGVKDSFVTFVDYLDVCYKHAATYKSDIDDYVKVH